MNEKRMNASIIEGNLLYALTRYFVPIFLGTLLQQSYQTIDAIIIGQFAGRNALAAIDSTGGFINLLIRISVGISSGASVALAQYYGAKDQEKLSKAAHTTLCFMAFLGIIVTAIGMLATPWICRVMNVPNDILEYAVTYTKIYFSGALFILLYNAGAGIMRSLGDTKRPFYFLSIGCVVNIILDLLLVAWAKMEIRGAALATVLSQGVSALLTIGALFKPDSICRINVSCLKISALALKNILSLGVPIALQSASYSVSNIFMQSSINQFGTVAVAGWSVCGKLDFLLWTVVESLAITATTFVAQNYGAKQIKRMFSSVNKILLLAAGLLGGLSAIYYFGTEVLGYLFVSDGATVNMAVHMMHWIAPFYVTCIGGEILSAVIRGTGDTFKPMILNLLGTCAFRIVWILAINNCCKSIFMVLMGYPLSWILASLMFLVYYFSVKRHINREYPGCS